ncbi:MAG: DUF2274 domain-containing protein [Alphaproteobacteria bacterium]|nr:DUF2274 domain-containing protein [Alphaproteobacteria bacterium]
MPEIKLAKLPDRTPVKIAIIITPELNRMLQAYAGLYRERYGEAEPVQLLIPAMIESFLKSDIAFGKTWKERGRDAAAPNAGSRSQTRARHREATELPTTSG